MNEAQPASDPTSQHFVRGVEIGRKQRETEIIALLDKRFRSSSVSGGADGTFFRITFEMRVDSFFGKCSDIELLIKGGTK